MEDILDLYAEPYDPRHPLLCIDEFSMQLLDEKVEPIPLSPGKARKEDYEYIRKGSCSVFVVVEPLAGKRWVVVTGKRRKEEFVEIIWMIAEDWYNKENAMELEL